jgi:hypothetical protein
MAILLRSRGNNTRIRVTDCIRDSCVCKIVHSLLFPSSPLGQGQEGLFHERVKEYIAYPEIEGVVQ